MNRAVSKVTKFIINSKNEIKRIDIIFFFFFAVLFSISKPYIEHGEFCFETSIIFRTIFFFVLFVCLSGVTRVLITPKSESKKISKFFDSKHQIIKNALIISACWLPILFLLFPGSFYNDTWRQLGFILEFKNTGVLIIDAQNPVFTTIFMSLIMIPIHDLTNNWYVAMAIYTFIQVIITSLVFSYTIYYAKNKLKLNSKVLLMMLLLYSFVPLFPEIVSVIVKDSIAAWCFVLFMINICEICRTKGDCLTNKKDIVSFILFTCLMIISKKVNLYIAVFTLIFVIICNRKRFIEIIVSTISIGVIILLCFAFETVFNIRPGGIQEMFSIPFQCTARYVINYEDEVTDEERTIISKVLDYENLESKYRYNYADPIKGYKQITSTEDYIKYFGIWVQQGLKHPDVYVDAILAHDAKWFSYERYSVVTGMHFHDELNEELFPKDAWNKGEFLNNTEKIENGYVDVLYKLPFTHLLLTFGFYAFLVPLFTFVTSLKKKEHNWVVAIPIILSVVLGCLLAPVSFEEGHRYLYPVIYSFPLCLAWCSYVIKKYCNTQKKVV